MRSPTLTLAMILTMLFVSAGDILLPQPLAGASYHTRTHINQFFLGLFPNVDLNHLERDRLWDVH